MLLTIQNELQGLCTWIKQVEDSLQILKENEKAISQLTKTVRELGATVQKQQERLVSFEDRSRRNNLMVFGLPEEPNETPQDLRSKVLNDVMEKKLHVTLNTVERLHTIGKKQTTRPRPVVLRLYDYREKVQLYKNCKNLKGTGISVSDNFSKETLAKPRPG